MAPGPKLGFHVPVRNTSGNQELDLDTRTLNALLRDLSYRGALYRHGLLCMPQPRNDGLCPGAPIDRPLAELRQCAHTILGRGYGGYQHPECATHSKNGDVMTGMYQPQNDPDQIWGPYIPPPGLAALTVEEEDLAAYNDYADSMQMRDTDQRAESDPNWTASTWPSLRWPWDAEWPAENEADAEAGH